MGIRVSDECVGCPTEKGCVGDSCPNRNVNHYFCDDCGDEHWADELYHYEDEMLCVHCLLKRFEKVGI